MEFSRQEYWSGLSFPSLRDLPDPGTEPGSPELQTDSLPTELQEVPLHIVVYIVGDSLVCTESIVCITYIVNAALSIVFIGYIVNATFSILSSLFFPPCRKKKKQQHDRILNGKVQSLD